ncbi:MAG: 50S ribosomal protein L3 [Deltaproteobacteria bacterium]|nr:50S ribosomal protein L3 [Deltaproteobacteria bacterium]
MSKSKRLGLMATKVGMTQLFMDDGLRVAVTVLKVDPNVVVQKRTMENDGYCAVQVGACATREKLVNQAMAGHFKKANVGPQRVLHETRMDAEALAKLNVGDTLPLDLLKGCKSLDVTGTSKGKGTAGVMKRHHMKGFRATHGTHEYFRHGGSIGCRATPGKVHKGKRMAGRMGNETVTTLNMAVVKIDEAKGLVFLRGAVPGAPGGVVHLVPSSHTAQRGRRMTQEAQTASKNPMKASKAGAAAAAKPAAKK